MRVMRVLIVTLSTVLARAEGIEVNGDFEAQTGLGWNEWQAGWSQGTAYDYAWAEEPFEGDSSLYMRASRGSFGVYQEFCIQPGVVFEISWAWRGQSGGNGWWEVLVVDGPYVYEAVDDPLNHPETTFAAKWEIGFGGPHPEPSEEWTTGSASITPVSDVVTLVLKCGSTEGGSVEAWFDEVTVVHGSEFLEVVAVEPSQGKVAGGDPIRVLGRNLPPDAIISLGENPLVDQLRIGTCEIVGTTPPGEPGEVDVTVTSALGAAALPGGFRYVPEDGFRRGNCNADGNTDITDAIALLGYLFLGSEEPPCLEACNADDDATLTISDAVVVLSFLFTGGVPPQPPYPDCGTDPTPSDISCNTPHPDC